MNNPVNIYTTKFTDIKTGEESYGFRICDNYESLYSNVYGDEITDWTPMQVLTEVSDICSRADSEILVNLVENEEGCYIDEEFHEWEEIKSVLE